MESLVYIEYSLRDTTHEQAKKIISETCEKNGYFIFGDINHLKVSEITGDNPTQSSYIWGVKCRVWQV